MLRKILMWIVGGAVVYVVDGALIVALAEMSGEREIARYLDWTFRQGAYGLGYGLPVVVAIVAAIGLGQSVIRFVRGKPVLGNADSNDRRGCHRLHGGTRLKGLPKKAARSPRGPVGECKSERVGQCH